MDDPVTLTFRNRDAIPEIAEMRVDRSATADIARWYGGFHAGDDYDVLIDGEIVEKTINGEID